MNWDTHLLAILNHAWANPFLDRAMLWITLSAMPGTLLFPLLITKKHKRESMTIWIAVLLATLMSVGIQFALDRPRPAGARAIIPMPAFPSFPSGHAAAAFAAATLIALFWPRPRAVATAFALAGIISFSRVYLGQHYPTDILGGAIVGAATALVIYGAIWAPATDKRPRWAWLLWGQLGLILVAILGAYLDILNLAFLALPGADKALHFGLFGALAFLSAGWWARRPKTVVLGLLALLATAEELLQAFSATRSFDLIDLGVTLLGILVFGALYRRPD